VCSLRLASQSESSTCHKHNDQLAPLASAGSAADPEEQIVVLEGDTEWGDDLTVAVDAPARYIRILTRESPSWIAWL